jgi:hypothetical protein
MEGQARVLKERVKASALQGRRVQPRERVRSEKQEGVKSERQSSLRAKSGDKRSARKLA